MADITIVVSGDVTLRSVRGNLTATDVIAVLEEYYAGTPTLHTIWDITQATVLDITPDDLRRIAAVALKHADARKGGKSAVVLPTDAAYGMGRILDALMELQDSPFEVRTFRRMEDAAEWLGIDTIPTADASD
jgi:hypothetical protein